MSSEIIVDSPNHKFCWLGRNEAGIEEGAGDRRDRKHPRHAGSSGAPDRGEGAHRLFCICSGVVPRSFCPEGYRAVPSGRKRLRKSLGVPFFGKRECSGLPGKTGSGAREGMHRVPRNVPVRASRRLLVHGRNYWKES